MTPKRSDEVLSDWEAVTRTATAPGVPTGSLARRGTGAGISLAGAGLLLVGLVFAFAWLGNREPATTVGDTTPPTSPPAIPTPAASSAAVATPEPSPTASPSPCYRLETPLTWEGAAGQRIATITITNRFDVPCELGPFSRVRYVDGANNALIDGPVPAGGDRVQIPPHSQVSTMVEIGNYCGPAPSQPVGILFTLPNGGFFVVGSPESQADMSVPPCNGPGQPATIQMQPWSGG